MSAVATMPFTSRSGCERLPKGGYRSDDLIVIPKPGDSLLAHIYLRWEREQTLPLIFYEGVPSISWFLNTYKDILTLACLRQPAGSDSPEVLGLGWFNTCSVLGGILRKAEGGMGFFRHTPPDEVRTLAEMMIRYAFQDLGCDVLFGTTPEKNPAAVRFIRKLGFQLFGPLPRYTVWQGLPCGAWISHMTKEQWEDQHGRS